VILDTLLELLDFLCTFFCIVLDIVDFTIVVKVVKEETIVSVTIPIDNAVLKYITFRDKTLVINILR
jgi:hypothetical protein